MQSIPAEFDGTLTKPINLADLLTLLEEHLNLKWHYKKAESPATSSQLKQKITPPPQDELATLYDLAMRGNMRLIREHASRIAALDKTFEPFVNKLHQFAIVFDGNAILELIEQYLEGTP